MWTDGLSSFIIFPYFIAHSLHMQHLMIRRILLALDPDNDTPVAMRHAFEVAHRYGAHVTGIACVDTRRIEKSAAGGGIGSMHYAEKIREKLVNTTRKRATDLIKSFAEASEQQNITYSEIIKEGSPSERIIEETRYHELLVIGNDPHFFYGHPEERTTTLAHVVKGSVCPVLVVPDEYRAVKNVLFAFDGSTPASRAMQLFAMMKPFGADLDVHVVQVYRKGHEAKAELEVAAAAEYLEVHGFSVHRATMQGEEPFDHLMECARNREADLVLAGAHSVSKIRQKMFGSTTETLVTQSQLPMFLER